MDEIYFLKTNNIRFLISKQGLRKYIERSFDNLKIILAIVERETLKHIGNISLQKIDLIFRTAEFAIIIGERNIWKKGYGKEAIYKNGEIKDIIKYGGIYE